MRRIDHAIGDVQRHRPRRHAAQHAAPPGEGVVVVVVALDNDQQVRIDREDGVAGAGRRRRPVVGGAAAGRIAAPARGGVRLVAQVHADHGGVAVVTRGQCAPVGEEGALGEFTREPQAVFLCRVAGVRAVVVENDAQADLAAVRDDLVEHVERPRVGRDIGVDAVAVDAVGADNRVLRHHLVGIRDAHGVEA
jgi:hypothetical protein